MASTFRDDGLSFFYTFSISGVSRSLFFQSVFSLALSRFNFYMIFIVLVSQS